MINGFHAIIHTRDDEKVRAFFRDILKFPYVDAGHGWLIFALPPAELGIHPSQGDGHSELYLMCDDIHVQVRQLQDQGVTCDTIVEAAWGLVTALTLPGGGKLGLYQPKHPVAHSMKARKKKRPSKPRSKPIRSKGHRGRKRKSKS